MFIVIVLSHYGKIEARGRVYYPCETEKGEEK